MSDNNSLCWRESIGGVALYVNGKAATTYAVIGVGHGGRAYEGCQGQGGISLQRWNLLGVESVEYKMLCSCSSITILFISVSNNQDLKFEYLLYLQFSTNPLVRFSYLDLHRGWQCVRMCFFFLATEECESMLLTFFELGPVT